jgi:hypothetical protein
LGKVVVTIPVSEDPEEERNTNNDGGSYSRNLADDLKEGRRGEPEWFEQRLDRETLGIERGDEQPPQ